MEKEIGSIPDRNGFDVHVDGEEITITQYNGNYDADVVRAALIEEPNGLLAEIAAHE